MVKRIYSPENYGAYLADLLRRHNVTKMDFAQKLDVSRTYVFDLLAGRTKPPAPAMQEKIATVLGLNPDERADFFDITALGRKEIPKDIFLYLYNNEKALAAIREQMKG